MRWSKCDLRAAMIIAAAVTVLRSTTFAATPQWSNFAGDAQHTADSSVASDNLGAIRWQTPVDLDPQYSTSGELLIHYGSPLVTATNNVIVPVKTGATGGFQIDALSGSTGSSLWTATTDYILPPTTGWTPSYAPALTPTNRLYYAGAGGTIYYRDNADTATPSAPTQIAFYGTAAYQADPSVFNSSVYINTPITSDSAGDIYFGFRVSGIAPAGSGLPSNAGGIARIAANGTTTFITATAAAAPASNASSITTDVMNCAPALSNNGSTVYMTVSNAPNAIAGAGDLVALNSTTLAPEAAVPLLDPTSGKSAWLADDGTASPTVGPDGQVYIGVLENPFPANNDRGWMLSFSSNLSQSDTPGSFGWDDTASIVPSSMIPSYTGTSKYLLMTKYNNYAGIGTGNGVNQIAILDPNATMTDPVTGATVMKVVESIAGVTPDADKVADGYPDAVDEWCIDSAVVDPATDSVIAGSEDGKLYRWDLATNTFTQMVTLTSGLGEAYTPTMIAADGSVLAINNATLFDIVPEPGTIAILAVCGLAAISRRRRAPISAQDRRP